MPATKNRGKPKSDKTTPGLDRYYDNPDYQARVKARAAARNRALTRLKNNHPDDYREIASDLGDAITPLIRSQALTLLSHRHPDELRRLYLEELPEGVNVSDPTT